MLKLQKVTQKLLVSREDSGRVNEVKKTFTKISHNRIDIDEDMFFFLSSFSLCPQFDLDVKLKQSRELKCR